MQQKNLSEKQQLIKSYFLSQIAVSKKYSTYQMGNNKSKSQTNATDVIFNEVYNDDSCQDQIIKHLNEEDSYFSVSNNLNDAKLYLKSVDNQLKINIDSLNMGFFDLLQSNISQLSQRVTSLFLRSSLQVKENMPIEQIIGLLNSLAKQNKIKTLNIKFEFVYLDYGYFERVVEIIKSLSQLSNLHLRLTNNMLFDNDYVNRYSIALNNKINLKQLYILFSFKNTIISRQGFEVYLQAFSMLHSIESIQLSIENPTYTSIALDVIYSVIQHKNLELINLDILQYRREKGGSPYLNQDILNFEEKKNKILTSNLNSLTISNLGSNYSHIFFSLIYNLPKIQQVNVIFQKALQIASEIEVRPIQELSEEKKFIDNLSIIFEGNLQQDNLHQIFSSFNKFYANRFVCIFSNLSYTRYNDEFYGLNQIFVNSSFLSIVWNQVEIVCEKSYQQIVEYYLAGKISTIQQYLIFSKLIKPFMICNPQYIYLDLYIP